MHIRVATEDDLETINNIYDLAIAEQLTADTISLSLPERKRWFEDHDQSTHPVFVYELNSRVIAWLSFSKYRAGRAALSKTIEISYYVDKEFRKQGIGSELIHFARQAALKHGFKNLLAIVLERNRGSIRLLEKWGFQRWGYLPNVADFNGETCGHFYYGVNI